MIDQTKQSAWDSFAFKVLTAMAKSKNVFELIVDNAYAPKSGMPIIFAPNHSNCNDFPITTMATGRHLRVLVGKQRLGFINRFFLHLNGVIYVDRFDKEKAAKAKKRILRALQGRLPLCWYPEGTWNLTDNLLMLPMKWGIIEIAAKARAQIIPIALEYDRETMICRARFGEPMYGEAFSNKASAITALRDSIATLKWEIMESCPLHLRDSIDTAALKADILQAITEYPYFEVDKEQRVVYRPYYAVDVFPSTIAPSSKTAFLFNKRLF